MRSRLSLALYLSVPVLASVVGAALGQARQVPPSKVDFARDVLPLLKAHCFQCHGPSQSLGGLRLDSRDFAMKGGASGAAIVTGSGARSLLLSRILGLGGKPRMPLGFGALTDRETTAIRSWIDEGAPWPAESTRTHWAFVKPIRPAIPTVKRSAWIRNPIDSFVLAGIERAGLQPSPEADRVTLIRRLTLDLTGLPPTPAEVDSFLRDTSANAYEKVVDRLFASPHYGERMALPWLDAARYADSNGFQQDGDTYQYVWRDWVVRAMNDNIPFDQFTIQQIAGDLLPNATLDQKIATGFNRCHLLNGEGGAIPEEQRNVILFDRVDVTATTWLAATMACAQCHNHKYDPYTQRDYYRFMAYFNNVPETGTPPGGGQYRIADPSISAPSAADSARISEMESRLSLAREDVLRSEKSSGLEDALVKWETTALKSTSTAPRFESWSVIGPFTADSFDAAYDKAFPPEKEVDLGKSYLDGKLKWEPRDDLKDGEPYAFDGDNSVVYFTRTINAPVEIPATLSFGSDDAIKVWLNGKLVISDKVTRAVLPDQEKITVKLATGENRLLVKVVNGGGPGGFYFKAVDTGLPADVVLILTKPAAERTESESKRARDYFLSNDPPAELKLLRERVTSLQKELESYRANLPRVMIMSDAKPRTTHVLQRGNYEMPGEVVDAGTPAFLPAPPTDTPKNRLGLARWLVSPENPLTARVQVNRYWQIFFGDGIVKTSENLGTQCDPPTNQSLLDWLAVDFRESGWNVKRLQKMIVMSSTYRQSSRTTPMLRQRDPENKLLARATRFRLPSLLIRDVALASSSLLNDRIGGKPVYPYQPKGIWDGLAITNERDFTYPQSDGPDLFRRSLYTFWRRTAAPADIFDASARQTCKVRLTVTSTPLHALTTLNDVVWVEAGRNLAEHVMKEAGPTPPERLAEAFRRICARRPSPDELRVLLRSFDRALVAYRANPRGAIAYLSEGESPRDRYLDPAVHAAYATACLAIYNLDEALTRE